MNKYIIGSLLFVSFSVAFAQIEGDVAPLESASSCTTLSHNLLYKKSKDSNTNGEVTDLQYFLQDYGYLKAEPTGTFGPSTLRAVLLFQKRNGLLSSGFVGPYTRAKIKDISCSGERPPHVESPTAPVKPSTPSTQSALVRNGSSTAIFEPQAPSSPLEYRLDSFGIRVTKVSLPYLYIEYANLPPSGISLISKTSGKSVWQQELTSRDGFSGASTITIPEYIYTNPSYHGNYVVQAYGQNARVFATSEPFYIGGKDLPQPVVESPQSSTGKYEGYLNGAIFIRTDSISKEEALLNCKTNASNNSSKSIRCIWNGVEIYSAAPIVEMAAPTSTSIEVPGPKINAMKCANPPALGLTDGKVACYGLWDYGNEFGDDSNMCPEYGYGSTETGCRVMTKACASGVAVATKKVNPRTMASDSPDLAHYAKNLKSTPEAVKQQVISLWVYTCGEAGASTNTSYNNQTLSNTANVTQGVEAIAFGVYEGMYPNNDSPHSGSFHPEGTINLTIPLSAANKVLVLTSYEPVNWILYNPQRVTPKKIIIIGYHTQRVTGQVPDVPVESHSYYTDKVVQFAYQSSDRYFTDLVAWLAKQNISLTASNFTGAYAAKDSPLFNKNRENSTQSLDTSLYSTASPKILGDYAVCANIPINMHRGAESSYVHHLQAFLNSLGYLGEKPTGFYGDKTVQAVREYQLNKGLPPTGMVYSLTRNAIKEDGCP